MTKLTYIHMYIDIYEKRALWVGKRRNLFAFEANILYYTMFLFGFRGMEGYGVCCWLFVSWCQSCHIYHGRVPWGQRVAHTHLSLSFFHIEWVCTCILYTLYSICCPLLPPVFVVVVRCKVIAVLSPGAIMPHLSTERYDINTVQHTTTQHNTTKHRILFISETFAVVIAIGSHSRGV